jgi:hypothetical protein
MIDENSDDYTIGFSEGYSLGHKDGINNKSRRELCKYCDIDIEKAKETNYICKVLFCDNFKLNNKKKVEI